MANVCQKCFHYILDKANTLLDIWHDNLAGKIQIDLLINWLQLSIYSANYVIFSLYKIVLVFMFLKFII